MKTFVPCRRFFLTLALALLAFGGLQAQTIHIGDKFTDGFRPWTVEEIRMGNYVYMTDGDGGEITLEKVKGETGVYKLVPSRQAEEPPFAGVAFGCNVEFTRKDGNLVLAALDPEGNPADFLYPLVERKDYRFETSLLKDPESPEYYDRVSVKGLTGGPFSPEFSVELYLAQVADVDSDHLNGFGSVDDQIDLNFDGIPDMMVSLGISPTRGAPTVQFGFVWDDLDHCFKSLPTGYMNEPFVDPENKTITLSYADGPEEVAVEIYAWVNDELMLIEEFTHNPFFEYGDEFDGLWYSGSLVYTADPSSDGVITMNATAEGEEMEFVLVPVSGDEDTYTVEDGPNDYVNPFASEETVWAVHRIEDDWDVLCFYRDGNLLGVYTSTETEDAQLLNINEWLFQFLGEYTLPDGTTVRMDVDNAFIGDDKVPMEAMTFNGDIVGVVEIADNNSPLKGLFEIEPTVEGLTLHQVVYDDDLYWYNKTGTSYKLAWKDKDISRFSFASDVLLTKGIRMYDKKFLRMMRNAILARHGYVFQSKDLKDYFGSQPWYHPAESNDGISLSFLEQLNVDLIKQAEK